MGKKSEFTAAADRLDYVGEADALWKSFTGSDQSSYISLHAMAPYVVDELLAFKRLLEAKRKADAPKTNEKKAPSWDRAEAEKERREALNWIWHEVFVGASVSWGVAQKRTIGLAAFVKSCE